MSNPDHHHEQLPVSDGVDDSIPAHSYPIPIVLSGKLLAPRWPRTMGQRMDGSHDALAVLLLINGLDLLGRRRLDEDSIACHAA